MNTRWFALYVRQRREHPENITAEEHRKLADNVQLAMSLGATVVTRESEDIAGAIRDFASEEHINVLIVGKPTRHGLVSRFVPSVVHRLMEGLGGRFIIKIKNTAIADERP